MHMRYWSWNARIETLSSDFKMQVLERSHKIRNNALSKVYLTKGSVLKIMSETGTFKFPPFCFLKEAKKGENKKDCEQNLN